MRVANVVLTSLALMLVALPAYGQGEEKRPTPPEDRPQRPRRPQQRPPRPVRLEPEEALAAWQLQARTVARDIELSEELTDQLVDVYIEAREHLAKATREARQQRRDRSRDRDRARDRDRDQDRDRGRGEGEVGDDRDRPRPGQDRPGGRRGGRGGDRPGFGSMNRELVAAERQRFQKTISAFLTEEQVESVLAAIGSLSPQMDLAAHAIVGFELGPEKTHQALHEVQQYAAALLAARRDHDDRQARREAIEDAREKLRDALAGVLDEQQMTRLQRALGRGGMGRGGRGAIIDRLMESDANGDGKLQRDELPERMGRLFDRLDTNGDGVLDAEELEDLMNARRGRITPDGEIF